MTERGWRCETGGVRDDGVCVRCDALGVGVARSASGLVVGVVGGGVDVIGVICVDLVGAVVVGASAFSCRSALTTLDSAQMAAALALEWLGVGSPCWMLVRLVGTLALPL